MTHASTRGRLSRAGVVAFILGAAVSLNACNSDQKQSSEGSEQTVGVSGSLELSSPDEPISTPPNNGLTLQQVDLVAALWYTPQEQAYIDQAWGSLFSTCMNEAGYEVAAPRQTPVDTRADERRLHQILFDDIELIRTYGYGWQSPDFKEGPASTDDGNTANGEVPIDEIPIDEIPIDEIPIDEIPIDEENDTRCREEANAPFDGSDEDMLNLLFQEQRDLRAESQQSWLEFDELTAAWAACMDSAGFPGQSFADREWLLDWILELDVAPGEMEYALADYECRGSSGIRDALIARMKLEVAQWEAEPENQAFILEVNEAVDRRVATAKEILGRD